MDEYARLLGTYVKYNGVEYSEWKRNPQDIEALGAVVLGIANADVTRMTPKERLAFYLNAYHANLLNEILEHFPVTGPLDISPIFYHAPRVEITASAMSFDHLETRIIRPAFRDVRVHFALSKGTQGGPPLHNQPFRAETLEDTLQALTVQYLNSEAGLRYEDEAWRLTKLFDWYAADFNGRENFARYLNQYLKEPIHEKSILLFDEYSWDLNEVPPGG